MRNLTFAFRSRPHLLRHRIWLLVLLCAQLFVAANTLALEPTFKGEFIQGSFIIGKLELDDNKRVGEIKVTVSGKDINLTPDGFFAFGIGRDEQGPLALELRYGADFERYEYSIEQREYAIQRIEGVKQKHVTPKEEVLERIRAEGAKVRRARAKNDARTDFLQAFIWPLVGPITGVYGSQRFYNGVPRSPHYGLDIAAPQGTKVVAPAAGIVTLAEPDLYYSGGTLILDHGHGVSSTFIHLHKVSVEVGQVIAQGDVIAEVGATGRATGPHLDWRMNWFEHRLDPALLMKNTPMAE